MIKLRSLLMETTIEDEYMGLTRTPAVKRLIQDIKDGWSFVENMPLDQALITMKETRNFWQKVLDRRKQIHAGKIDIEGKDLENLRYWEGKYIKELTPKECAEKYGIPEAERMLIDTDRTTIAINKLHKLYIKRININKSDDD